MFSADAQVRGCTVSLGAVEYREFDVSSPAAQVT